MVAVSRSTEQLTEKKVRMATTKFGLRARHLRPCASQYIQNAGYRVQTNHGVVFIKPFRGTRTRLTAVANTVHVLTSAHFPHLVPWLHTLDHRSFVQVSGHVFYATRWLHGTPFTDDLQGYEHLGRALAMLHSLPQRTVSRLNLPTRSPLPSLNRSDKRFRSSVRPYLSEHDSKDSPDNAWRQWMLDHFEQINLLSDTAWASLDDHDARQSLHLYLHRPCLLHGDVTRPNLICTPHWPYVYLLDWELTKLGCAMTDLATAMTNTTDFRTEAMERLLTGYEQQRHLSKGDRTLLCALFQFPREVWHLSRHFDSSTARSAFETLSARWEARLAAVAWLQRRLQG